jgi:hypothetical protein
MVRRLFAISVVLFIAFAGCKKASGPANGKSVQPNNHIDSTVAFNAMINNISWQTDSAFGYLVNNSANDSGIVNLMITAIRYSDTTPSTITFNITNYTGANTYTIDPPVNTATYYVGNNRHFAKSGSITIMVNQIIVRSDTGYSLTGVFNFVADTIKVTNGAFNVAQP